MDLIISVEEARELLGDDAKKMSDDQIEKLIEDFDVLARAALKMAREDLNEAKKPKIKTQEDRSKADALALAQLIYDIYQDKKRLTLDKNKP